MINRWRIKQQKAKLDVIVAWEKYFKTGTLTLNEETGMDLWGELSEFNHNPVICANFPLCNTGIYWKYEYKLCLEGDKWGLEEDDAKDYNYYCFNCYRKFKDLKN